MEPIQVDLVITALTSSVAVGGTVYLALSRKLESEFDARYAPIDSVPCKEHSAVCSQLDMIRQSQTEIKSAVDRLTTTLLEVRR